jgi:hypothetical protein
MSAKDLSVRTVQRSDRYSANHTDTHITLAYCNTVELHLIGRRFSGSPIIPTCLAPRVNLSRRLQNRLVLKLSFIISRKVRCYDF